MLLKFSRYLFFLFLITLFSCSYFEDEEDIKLSGKRENVFEIDEKTILKASKKIEITPPILVKFWPQQHQNVRNHLFHFESNESLKLKKKLKLAKINFEKFNHVVEPVIIANKIYFSDSEFNIFSKDLINGKVIWKISLEEEKDESLSFIGGLSVSDNELIITTGLGNLYSIDLKDGKVKWKKKFVGQFSRPPTIFKNKIFAVSDDNQLLCLDLDSGEVNWSHVGSIEEVSIIGGAKPAVFENTVVVSYSSGEIFALDHNNGNILWFDSAMSGNFFNRNIVNDIQSPLTIEDNLVYVPTFSDNFFVYRIKDGKKLWNLKFSSINPFIITGEIIYVLDITGKLLCLEKKTGKLIWAVQLRQKNKEGEIFWRGPMLTSNKLLLASSDGSVISLSPYTGKILSKLRYSENFVLSPFQVDKRIFLITSKGEMFIFE